MGELEVDTDGTVLDGVAGFGVDSVFGLDCDAAVVNPHEVGDEQRRETALSSNLGLWSVPFLRSCGDGGGTTIHVEFAIADFVDPRPSDGVLTGSDALGDGVLEHSGAGTRSIVGEVASDVGGAVALDGLDDHPLGVGGGLLVGGQGDLARTAAVDRTALEAEGLRLPDDDVVLGTVEIVDPGALLAWEVASVGRQWRVVEGLGTVGHGGDHLHVAMDRAEECHGGGDSQSESGMHGADGYLLLVVTCDVKECKKLRARRSFLTAEASWSGQDWLVLEADVSDV